MDLKPYYEMLESCIQDLGVDPSQTRGEKEGQWDLYKGSAHVMIDIFEHSNGYGYFQCIAPISEIPDERRVEFLEEVLDTAHQLFGAGFTKFKNWIYIKMLRELDGIDKSEITATINRIGNYADDYDDYFKKKYFEGGREE